MPRGDQLDDVGDQEVAGDEEVEGQSPLYIALAEVMAPDAYQDPVLWKLARGMMSE